jgi:hypothetical protein
MKYYRITMTMDYEAEDEKDATRQATSECDYTMQIVSTAELPVWPWTAPFQPEEPTK